MDKVSKKKRSEIMAAIRGKDSGIEVELRKALWEAGVKYRKNVSGYFGKPDILLKKNKIVIFVDSCFWHGCPKHLRMPSTRVKYWKEKIVRNKKRDKEVNRHYRKIGWTVLRYWEHDMKNIDKIVDTILNVVNTQIDTHKTRI